MTNGNLIRNLILKYSRVSREHLTPEIPLRLITADTELWSCRPEEIPFQGEPFWGFYWPGGQGISRYILDGGQEITGKNVLDIGSGCGACAIAAKMVGANEVLANDIDKEALEAIKINCEMNNVTTKLTDKNLIGSKLVNWDTVLIGDMFYDDTFGNKLFDWLKTLAQTGKTVYIGDPGRHCLTENRRNDLELMKIYDLKENSCIENSGFTTTAVWKVNQEKL